MCLMCCVLCVVCCVVCCHLCVVVCLVSCVLCIVSLRWPCLLGFGRFLLSTLGCGVTLELAMVAQLAVVLVIALDLGLVFGLPPFLSSPLPLLQQFILMWLFLPQVSQILSWCCLHSLLLCLPLAEDCGNIAFGLSFYRPHIHECGKRSVRHADGFEHPAAGCLLVDEFLHGGVVAVDDLEALPQHRLNFRRCPSHIDRDLRGWRHHLAGLCVVHRDLFLQLLPCEFPFSRALFGCCIPVWSQQAHQDRCQAPAALRLILLLHALPANRPVVVGHHLKQGQTLALACGDQDVVERLHLLKDVGGYGC